MSGCCTTPFMIASLRFPIAPCSSTGSGLPWAAPRSSRRASHGAFIDVDKFKSVNTSFGLVVGDSLLLTLARRLQRHLGPNGYAGPRRRRSVRDPVHRRAAAAGTGRAGRAHSPFAPFADQDFRSGDRAHRLHRYRGLRRREPGAARCPEGGRKRHVPRQARRCGPHRDLQPGNARRT